MLSPSRDQGMGDAGARRLWPPGARGGFDRDPLLIPEAHWYSRLMLMTCSALSAVRVPVRSISAQAASDSGNDSRLPAGHPARAQKAQRFNVPVPRAAANSAVDNTFNVQRNLISHRNLRVFRAAALKQWPVSGRRPPIRPCNNSSSSQLELSGSAALARRSPRNGVVLARANAPRRWSPSTATFYVEGTESKHPAGTYTVETQEERIEGLSFLAYRRVSTSIVLPYRGADVKSCQFARIDPKVVRSARVNSRGWSKNLLTEGEE